MGSVIQKIAQKVISAESVRCSPVSEPVSA